MKQITKLMLAMLLVLSIVSCKKEELKGKDGKSDAGGITEMQGKWEEGGMFRLDIPTERNGVRYVDSIWIEDYFDIEITYNNIQKANEYVKKVSYLNFLHKFHKFLQISTSHYTLDEGHAERLMLKYYEYLIKIKDLLKDRYKMEVLSNLNEFPLEVDPHLNEYYEKIAEKIKTPSKGGYRSEYNDRYYIRKIKPFFVNEKVYYEVTFTTAMIM